jgi:hypothetical protein
MRQVIKICNEWDKDNKIAEKQDPEDDEKPVFKRKPEIEQKKLVIHTLWMSQLQVLQVRLAQAGFLTKVLSGETPQHQLPNPRPILHFDRSRRVQEPTTDPALRPTKPRPTSKRPGSNSPELEPPIF